MKSQVLFEEDGRRTFAVVFDQGEEAVAALNAFAKEQGLQSAHFTGLGALHRASVGFFDRARKDYARIVLDEQVEVLSLVGNVARAGASVKLHAHVVLGKRDGTAHGGHLLEGHVWPTLEVVLTEEPPRLRRTIDAETGLPLLDLPDPASAAGSVRQARQPGRRGSGGGRRPSGGTRGRGARSGPPRSPSRR